MVKELLQWLDAQNIAYVVIDNEVLEIPDFGKIFIADLSGVESIFKIKDGDVQFNLMATTKELQDDDINYVAFLFGNNWYYYDIREEFRFNILKHIGRPNPPKFNIPFVNLGIHTPYELLNASGSLEELCRKAKWFGHTAIGICDRNTMAATLNLQKECARQGLKHIFGYTLTIIHDEVKVDVKIYALSNVGLQNLLNLQREVMVNSEDSTIEYSKLFAYVEGCVLVFSTRSAHWITEHSRNVQRLKERFDKVYYQVDGNEYKADRIDREQIGALKHFFEKCYDASTDTFVIEPILIADSYYIDKDEAKSKLVLNKIATGAAHEQSEEQYFKNIDEHYDMLCPLFSERWDFDRLFERMCRHTVDIAERADAAFETGKMFMPEYMMHPDERERYGNRRAMFLKLLDEGLEVKISKSKHKVYRERLEEEVYIIESTDNVDYFLVQWDMVREAKRRGIATGIGRGSAGGSLVSYLLGITSIDPIKYDLIFSRFLVPERCGLSWKDELTVLAPDITMPQGASYIEVEIDKNTYRLHPESELRIVRNGVEMTITADKLTDGDDILLDRRDCLWNLKEVAFQQ